MALGYVLIGHSYNAFMVECHEAIGVFRTYDEAKQASKDVAARLKAFPDAWRYSSSIKVCEGFEEFNELDQLIET